MRRGTRNWTRTDVLRKMSWEARGKLADGGRGKLVGLNRYFGFDHEIGFELGSGLDSGLGSGIAVAGNLVDEFGCNYVAVVGVADVVVADVVVVVAVAAVVAVVAAVVAAVVVVDVVADVVTVADVVGVVHTVAAENFVVENAMDVSVCVADVVVVVEILWSYLYSAAYFVN